MKVGLTTLLTVLFVGLKLTSYIDWSWWWVLSPLWLPVVALVGGALLITSIWGLFVGIQEIIKGCFK